MVASLLQYNCLHMHSCAYVSPSTHSWTDMALLQFYVPFFSFILLFCSVYLITTFLTILLLLCPHGGKLARFMRSYRSQLENAANVQGAETSSNLCLENFMECTMKTETRDCFWTYFQSILEKWPHCQLLLHMGEAVQKEDTLDEAAQDETTLLKTDIGTFNDNTLNFKSSFTLFVFSRKNQL